MLPSFLELFGEGPDITYITKFTHFKRTGGFSHVPRVCPGETSAQIRRQSTASTQERSRVPQNGRPPQRLPLLRFSCLLTFTEWTQAVRARVCLAPSAQEYVCEVRVVLPFLLHHCTGYKCFNSFIHSPPDGGLGHFQFGAIANETTMNTLVHVFW